VCKFSSCHLSKPKKDQLISLAALLEGEKYSPIPVNKTIAYVIKSSEEIMALILVVFLIYFCKFIILKVNKYLKFYF